MNEFIGNIFKFFAKLLVNLLGLLPASPVDEMLGKIGEFDILGYINWFIPFDFCLTCLNIWLLCVGAYYIFIYAADILKLVGALK